MTKKDKPEIEEPQDERNESDEDMMANIPEIIMDQIKKALQNVEGMKHALMEECSEVIAGHAMFYCEMRDLNPVDTIMSACAAVVKLNFRMAMDGHETEAFESMIEEMRNMHESVMKSYEAEKVETKDEIKKRRAKMN